MVFTINGMLLSLNKEERSAICDNMNEHEDIMQSELKPATEGQILHNIIYMRNLK